MGGNIGTSFSLNVLDENKSKNKNTVHILELSSFQLERIDTFKPYIACILNLSEDHLDRYSSLTDYYNAKLNITKNLNKECYLIYNKKDRDFYLDLEKKTNLIEFALKGSNIIFFLDGNHIIDYKKNEILIDCKKIKLKGNHNIENILASIQIAKLFDINNTVIKNAILNFDPLEHRMESIETKDSITYINDSKATNIRSTIKAIESSNQKTILILGGYSKGKTNYEKRLGTQFDNISNIICYGSEGENIYKQLKDIYNCQYIKEFKKAIVASINIAKINNRVLLSPACSSYDQFNNFEERGNEFKRIVKKHVIL